MTTADFCRLCLPGVILIGLSYPLAACDNEKSTAEKVGEAIEETGEEAGEAIEETGEKAGEATEKAGEAAEDVAQ